MKVPPRWADKFLEWYCNKELLEDLQGDLHERFNDRAKRRGATIAKILFVIDVIVFFRPYTLKRRTRNQKPGSMPSSITKLKKDQLLLADSIAHFFKISLRSLARNKLTTILNLAGLTIGLCSFLLIAFYVLDELTYDRHHPNSNNIYRISYSFSNREGKKIMDSRAAGLWGATLKEKNGNVLELVRFSRFGYPGQVQLEDNSRIFLESAFYWTDSTYSKIFPVTMIAGGEPVKILRDPNAVIVTEAVARKYFGNGDPMNKTLIYQREEMEIPLTVRGVMKNAPSNTHAKPDFLASHEALVPLWKRNDEDRISTWSDSFSYTFIELRPGTDPNQLVAGLKQMFLENLDERGKTTDAILVPIADIHYSKDMRFELEPSGDKSTIYILGSIGLLIILIAAINYMNLSTARSMQRSKEVGLKKAFGSLRYSLAIQFICESLIVTFFALILAIGTLIVMIPSINTLTGKTFTLATFYTNEYTSLFILSFVLLGMLAGSYPAFYLSSFKPIAALRGQTAGHGAGQMFRKVLVVVQFTMALFLLACTFVFNAQMAIINNDKLGANQNNMLTLWIESVKKDVKMTEFRNAINSQSGVGKVAVGNHLPRLENYGVIERTYVVPELGDSRHSWQQIDADPDFRDMFNIEMVTGRWFSDSTPADTGTMVINETTLKELNLTAEQAIGLTIEDVSYTSQRSKVIGVMRDFSYESLHKQVRPLLISGRATDAETMYIKITGDLSATISFLEKTWLNTFPGQPFRHWFMSEEFDKLYKSEMQMQSMFRYLSGLAILICCLGLLGLTLFTIERKTKEIGIRKILGASTTQIIFNIQSRFIGLVALSLVFGTTLSYLAARQWLDGFVYQASLEIWTFALPCAIVLFLASLTMTLQSIRAALANPATSIRHE
jgi:putative ABC transport system permease protein